VSFTVQAYPGQSFTGTVSQVRIQLEPRSTTSLNYTAVVAVANPDGKLLPGMTATVSSSSARASDALSCRMRRCVSSLRLQPNASNGSSASTRPRVRNVSAVRQRRLAQARDARLDDVDVWYLDSASTLKPARVHVGLSDGTAHAGDRHGIRRACRS